MLLPFITPEKKNILHLKRMLLSTMSNFFSFLKQNVSESGFDSVIRNNRQGKVPAQLGPLEKASLIPLYICLKEVRDDGQCPKQQSYFL